MNPWKHIDETGYLKLDLRAHEILKGFPIHDVWQLDLPGGGEGRVVADIQSLFLKSSRNVIVDFLFAFRMFLGKIFGWDNEIESLEGSLQQRITEDDRLLSSVETGTKQGAFTVLYVYEKEAVSEIRNKTVHAALVWVLIAMDKGYRMLWAIHVKPVGKITAFYMSLITPFRLWIVYPSILKGLYKAWCKKYKLETAK